MGPKDRDYFMLRAEQERDAAAQSRGIVRQRHEELASAYRMRVNYMDRGLFGEHPGEDAPAAPQIIAAA